MEVDRLLVQRTAILLLGLTSFALGQICDERNYTVIDNPERSVDNIYFSNLCDRGLDEAKWFRFSSSVGDALVERAPNDPVPTMRCGTHAPIYIRGLGSHPISDFTTVRATVCAHYNGNACEWMGEISIYRCPVQGDSSFYFLYNLWDPTYCNLAYCVGWLASSSQATSSEPSTPAPTTATDASASTTATTASEATTDWYEPPQPCTRSTAVYMNLEPGVDAHGVEVPSTIIRRGSPKCIVVCKRPCTATILANCTDNPCQNSGTCFQLSDGYRCECPPSFTGTNCDQGLDCDGVTCMEQTTYYGG